MTAHPEEELVPAPRSGRVYAQTLRPGLADCAPSGRMRLDAMARWLQDVASADMEDAGVSGLAFWILRRSRVQVHRFPQINEHHVVRTFCSGIGRVVAERRTTISPAEHPDRPCVETAALWVHLHPQNRRPYGVTQDEYDIFSTAGYGERRVSHRLRHARPEPGSGTKLFDWYFRRVDTDVADHVNNAAYWEPVEEELLSGAAAPNQIDAEIEFRDGAQPGPASYLSDGAGRRFLLGAGGDLLATFALRPVADGVGSAGAAGAAA